MSLATHLLFLGHRRLAVALAEVDILIDERSWFEALRKACEFGELLTAQLRADEALIRDKLAALGAALKPAWQRLDSMRRRLDDQHHRLVGAVEARDAANVCAMLPLVANTLEQWAQQRMDALAHIEGAHGDVSTELARALSPPPDHPSR